MRSNGDKSVVKNLLLEFPNFQPLVPRMGMILKYLDQKKFTLSLISSVTSFLGAFPCHPPVTLSLPPTTDARAESNDRGREAREVQAVARGERVSTEERKFHVPVPSTPPPTTSAWTVEY